MSWSKTPPTDALDVILRRVHTITDRGCWLWFGADIPSGHGKVTFRKQAWYVHRLMYATIHGGIPTGALVTHTCDTPKCVSPLHLCAGTWKSNVEDMHRRGRARVGESHPGAKLSRNACEEIRSRCAAGERQRSIALDLGVSQSVVSEVWRGVAWRRTQHA